MCVLCSRLLRLKAKIGISRIAKPNRTVEWVEERTRGFDKRKMIEAKPCIKPIRNATQIDRRQHVAQMSAVSTCIIYSHADICEYTCYLNLNENINK